MFVCSAITERLGIHSINTMKLGRVDSTDKFATPRVCGGPDSIDATDGTDITSSDGNGC